MKPGWRLACVRASSFLHVLP